MSLKPISTESIRAALADLPAIRRVIHLDTIDSTNNLARQLASEGAAAIVLVSADEQTQGRGRRGRAWFTPPGTALAMSLLTRPAIPAQGAMRLTMLAGLAAVEGIEQATALCLGLKWPNDVVSVNEERMAQGAIPHPSSLILHPLKVGGILTECAFQGDQIEYAIVGLGLNVNVDFSQQPELLQVATSLKNLKGNEIDRLGVLAAIVKRFVKKYDWLHNEVKLRDAWSARLLNLGRIVKVQTGDAIVEGLAEGVDLDGALLVRSDDGQLHRLLSGDVTLHGLA